MRIGKMDRDDASTAVRERISGKVLAFAALFLALTGGYAWANVPRGSVGTKELKRGAVTTPKIAGKAVKTPKIAGRAVKTPKIAPDAVKTGKIANGHVRTPDLAAGAVKTGKLADDAATGAKVNEQSLDPSILQRRIANACPAGQAIRSIAESGAVTCQAGGGAPSGPAGGDLAGSYPNPTIGAAKVTSAKLADAAVTLPKLASNSVNSAKVVNNSLTGADIDESTLAGLWFTGGNAGTDPANDFLGTTDEVPLNLRVNDARALRLEPGSDGTNESPNVIGGIADNEVTDGVHSATIGGGGRGTASNPATANRVTDDFGAIGGGANNQAGDGAFTPSNRAWATVGGGLSNTASGISSTVGGGSNNNASGFRATVGGGAFNNPSGANATVGGGVLNTASGSQATVAGGNINAADGGNAVVGGGDTNAASAVEGTIAGGDSNSVTDKGGTIGGGQGNQAGDDAGTGDDRPTATVGGGLNNTASGTEAAVGGGESNTASATGSTVGGGFANIASGITATVPGGAVNVAQGDRSLAAGLRAKANHDGAFVWADSQNADMASNADDQFIARASGGFFLQDDSTLDDQSGFINTSTGAFLSNAGAWTDVSDENLKEGFAAVEPREVLAKLVELPVRSWQYKAEPGVRHLGPTAQDFHAAFGLGGDDRHLASLDANGVALAAIKGLSAVHEDLKAANSKLRGRLRRKDAVIASHERRLDRLERLLGR